MPNKGLLYLIPSPIAEGALHKITTPQLVAVLPTINDFLVEDVRTARRFLSALKVYPSIEPLRFSILNKDSDAGSVEGMMSPIMDGLNIGIISEAGCPAVADPGALAVRFAHDNNIQVVPLVGPSSILMALMGSGLNGQRFAFQGYLPVDKAELTAAVRDLEKESRLKQQTQIFIETPYRNQSIMDSLIKTLNPTTRLTVALDITGPGEKIITFPVKRWRQQPLALPKSPAVFLFLA
jgi:16S rRNA (cytidine1402-2'-O)-methyltransferase